jgi:hypothetical protein
MPPDEFKRRYSIWQAFGLSFYSRDLYRDVKENWRGTGFGLLFILIAFLGVARAVQFQFWAAKNLPDFAQKIPEFTMEKGILSTEVKPQPYRLDSADGCLVIDTTGKIQTLDQIPGIEGLKSVYLVTKTGYFSRRVRLGRVVDETHPFKPSYNFNATRENLDRWTAAIVRWSGTVLFVFYLPFVFLFEALALLIYALIGVLFAEMSHQELDYGDSLRLAVVSHIPVLFLFLVPALFQIKIPLSVLWSFLVSSGYIYFAVSSQPQNQASS